MTNKEADYIAYELSGILEHHGHANEIACYAHDMIARLRKKYKMIDDSMTEHEALYDERMWKL